MSYFVAMRKNHRTSPFVRSEGSLRGVKASLKHGDILITGYVDKEASMFLVNHETLMNPFRSSASSTKCLVSIVDTIYRTHCESDVIKLNNCQIYHFPTQICCSNGETLLILTKDYTDTNMIVTPSTSVTSESDEDDQMYNVVCQQSENLKPIIKPAIKQPQILKKSVKFLVTHRVDGIDSNITTKVPTDEVLPTEGGFGEPKKRQSRRKIARHLRFFRDRMEKMHRMCFLSEDKSQAQSLSSMGTSSIEFLGWREWKCPTKCRSIKKVVAGDDFLTILMENNDIYSVGCNKNGKLGLGTGKISCSEPSLVKLENPLDSALDIYDVDIATGKDHALAWLTTVISDRNTITEVQGWGCNTHGRLGNGGNMQNVIKPAKIEIRTESTRPIYYNREASVSCDLMSTITDLCFARSPIFINSLETDAIAQIQCQGEWSIFLLETGEIYVGGMGIESNSTQGVYPLISLNLPPIRSIVHVIGHDQCIVVELQDRSINLLTFGQLSSSTNSKVTPTRQILLRGPDRTSGSIDTCSLIPVKVEEKDTGRYIHNIGARDILAIIA